jgi:hypothetical protein
MGIKKERKMKYTKEFDIDNFPFWGGAKDTIKTVKKNGKMDELGELIESVFIERTPTETEINDFVWFFGTTIFETLGIINK